MVITFTVPAVPVAQPRQRHNHRGHCYVPKTHPVWAFKQEVALAARAAYQGPPLEGPVWMHLVLVFPRPQRLIWKTRPMPRQWHFVKPDRDNSEKSVQDALNGIIWVDDSQVCDGPITKFIAAGDEQPHVEVMVKPLD
jgi:Holliday junction resolvase RusA-like endonuclease